VHLPSYSSTSGGTTLQKRLEAAMILKGVVRVVLADGTVELEPKTWYKESGEHYLEALRRDSGEHIRLRVSEIRDVIAY
jgi:hypothetical protein